MKTFVHKQSKIVDPPPHETNLEHSTPPPLGLNPWFPHGLEKLGNLQKSGKSQGILPNILENEGILANFYFIFSPKFLFEVYLLNKFLYLLNSLNKTLKNTGKLKKKYTGKVGGKSGKYVSPKMFEPCNHHHPIYTLSAHVLFARFLRLGPKSLHL